MPINLTDSQREQFTNMGLKDTHLAGIESEGNAEVVEAVLRHKDALQKVGIGGRGVLLMAKHVQSAEVINFVGGNAQSLRDSGLNSAAIIRLARGKNTVEGLVELLRGWQTDLQSQIDGLQVMLGSADQLIEQYDTSRKVGLSGQAMADELAIKNNKDIER